MNKLSYQLLKTILISLLFILFRLETLSQTSTWQWAKSTDTFWGNNLFAWSNQDMSIYNLNTNRALYMLWVDFSLILIFFIYYQVITPFATITSTVSISVPKMSMVSATENTLPPISVIPESFVLCLGSSGTLTASGVNL